MLEGILQGLISNALTKAIGKLLPKRDPKARLVEKCEISIDCTSRYLDYLLTDDKTFTDVEIKLTNNTSNLLYPWIEIIHAEIDGPILGPFSSTYVVSKKTILDQDGKKIILKPFSNVAIRLEKFADTADRKLAYTDNIEAYPGLPTSEFVVALGRNKFVSTLAGFHPPIPEVYGYKGVGMVLKMRFDLEGNTLTRTLYGGFARRSPDSKLAEVRAMAPTYYQFLSGVFDSGLILIEKNGDAELFQGKTQVSNHQVGQLNLGNGYDFFSMMVNNENSPCGAPIDVVLPATKHVNGNLDY